MVTEDALAVTMVSRSNIGESIVNVRGVFSAVSPARVAVTVPTSATTVPAGAPFMEELFSERQAKAVVAAIASAITEGTMETRPTWRSQAID